MSNIALWCASSIAKHVKSKVGSIHLHVEGFTRETASLSEWFELRITGPLRTLITKDQYKVEYVIDLGMVCVSNVNAYRLQSLLDVGLAALTNEIPVYRYGPSSDQTNDGSYLGVLVLTPGTVVPTIFDTSKVTPDVRQANLEASYLFFVV
jgi:hypothetical protein